LAQEYLAALTPAGLAINTAEAKLEKLPVTASLAQVKAIVAPLGAPVTKLQALNAAISSPTASGAGRSLESLGYPAIVSSGGGTCNGYATHGSGAVLQIGYTVYHHGFQLTAPGDCTLQRWANYSWKIPAGYSVLKADVGPSYSNRFSCAAIRFLGNGGSPLLFTTSGARSLGSMAIPQTGVAPVTVNFAGHSLLTIQVDYPCTGGSSSVIDVVNDNIS
jgi:hypothetical protein